MTIGGSLVLFVGLATMVSIAFSWSHARVPLSTIVIFLPIVVAMAFELSRDLIRTSQLTEKLGMEEVGALIARRHADVPKVVLDIAWKAQVRLCARFRRLAARRVNRNKIVVAIARELAGFVWAIAQQVKPI